MPTSNTHAWSAAVRVPHNSQTLASLAGDFQGACKSECAQCKCSVNMEKLRFQVSRERYFMPLMALTSQADAMHAAICCAHLHF